MRTSRRPPLRRATGATIALALAGAMVGLTCSWVAAPPALAVSLLPSPASPAPPPDPFYSYSGPLASRPPGAVLRTRTVEVAWLGLPTPVRATQILYRTTNQLGAPAVTVTTVLRALSTPAGVAARIVSYQMFYDGLASQCDPSYNLRVASLEDSSQVEKGDLVSGNDSQVEEALMTPYLAAGDTLVISDYEGENFAWGAGQQSGYQTLDGIRAAERFLGVEPSRTPVALVGYSGGSIATQWAAEMAPAYAPELDIVGAAAGGVPVDFAQELRYLNGSPSWAGVMPGVMVGVSRAFGVNLANYLSSYGKQIAKQVAGECANSFESAYPGLTIARLVLPEYGNLLADPVIAGAINELTMGTDGLPHAPILLGVGNSDGTGDGVIVAADVEGLAHLYCQRGVSVQFDEFKGLDHGEAAVPFEVHALASIQAWLAGVPTPDGCSSIGDGSSLSPLPRGTSPPTPPRGALSSGDVTAVVDGPTATAFDGPASFTINGTGAATLSELRPGYDQAGPTTFISTGPFFDVAVAPGSDLSGATLSVCGVGAARRLMWWDGSARWGAGAWEPMEPTVLAANPVAGGVSPCRTASLSESSSPPLDQIGNLVVALARTRPVVSAKNPGREK